MKNNKYILTLILSCLVFSNIATAQRVNRAPQIRFGIRAGFNMSDLTSAKGLDIWNGLAYFNDKKEYVGFTDTKPFKYGFNAGFTAQSNMTNNWYWQASLIFTTKGYKLNTQNVEINATADYIQLPIDVVYKYELNDRWRLLGSAGLFAGVGICGFTTFYDHYGEDHTPRLYHQNIQKPVINEELGTSNLIGCDYTVHKENVYWKDKDDTFSSDGTYRIDAGAQIGIGLEFWRMQFMINYQYSLTPFYDYNYDYSSRYVGKGNYKNSFDYFDIKTPSSPRQHVISFTLTYFFDNMNNGIRW